MNRDNFYILKNEDGKIFAYTASLEEVNIYIDKAVKMGMKYTSNENGIATIYTFVN